MKTKPNTKPPPIKPSLERVEIPIIRKDGWRGVSAGVAINGIPFALIARTTDDLHTISEWLGITVTLDERLFSRVMIVKDSLEPSIEKPERRFVNHT